MSWTSGPEVIVLIRPADSAGNDRGSQALYLLLFLSILKPGKRGHRRFGQWPTHVLPSLASVGGKRMQRSVEGTSSTGLLPYLQGQAAELLSQVFAFKRLVATQVPVYAYVILSKLDKLWGCCRYVDTLGNECQRSCTRLECTKTAAGKRTALPLLSA